ncbi:MAG TPA: FIST N-terminal domain-containing protein [Pseudomonadales bacterium]|nr:FIST N-terminal domain-containing protein [Pseudomonadales bacterium]
MRVEQSRFTLAQGWQPAMLGLPADLVLVFGERALLQNAEAHSALIQFYPHATQVFCSTAGEIQGGDVFDESIVVTAIDLEKTAIQAVCETIENVTQSYTVGESLAEKLLAPDLVHIFILSDGQLVNGTELARGFNERLPVGVTLTGGLAGDGIHFQKTLVGLNALPDSGNVVAIGFYGSALKVGYGSAGGWKEFGPERRVTASDASQLIELDGQPALDLYKLYLGDHSKELPGAALRFPICLMSDDGQHDLVRTILSVNEADKTMLFAGDIPHQAKVRLMRCTYDSLIQGAQKAAEAALVSSWQPQLAIGVSCVGRKIVLGPRVEEEVEAIRDAIGNDVPITGFYSYGELAPFREGEAGQLHNQTMTLTLLAEA